jgi:hypothetical protein
MKICVKCNQEKKLESFPKNSSKKGGIEPYCKVCRSKYSKGKKYHLKYYKQNSEKCKKKVYATNTSIQSGVYGLFENGECLYIGESKKPYNRMIQHKTWIKNPLLEQKWNKSQPFLYLNLRQHNHIVFGIIEICDNHKEKEQYYIDIYKPLYNK